MGDTEDACTSTGALRVFRTMFAHIILLGRRKQPGPEGPRGPKGCKGPDGPPPDVTRDGVGGADADISALVCSEFAAFASGIPDQFWSEFAPPPCDPFESFHTGDAQAYGEWRTGEVPLPAAISEHIQLHQSCADAAANAALSVSLVARQVRSVTDATEVARTICSVGRDYTTLYLVTTVETAFEGVDALFVFKTETLSPGGQRATIYSASIEQYFIDSTDLYKSYSDGPACAVLTKLGQHSANYLYPSPSNSVLVDKSRTITESFTETYLTTTGATNLGVTLSIAVIGILLQSTGVYYALVVPILVQDGGDAVAYAHPYIRGSEHKGLAVLVMSRADEITAIESFTGTSLIKINEKK